MDIRPKTQQAQTEQTSSQATNNDTGKFKVGTVPHGSGRLMIPPALQATLDVLSQKYGLPLNLNEVSLGDNLADKIAATRKIVDMVEADSKLLPTMFQLARKLMKSELRLAEFHKKLTKEAIRFNETIDRQTSEIFLAAVGWKARSAKLEHRTNLRAQLKDKRTEAYNRYYSDSVFGEESKIIDCEFEVLASNQKVLSDSKQERIKLESERKQKLAQYVNSAYQN